MDRSWPMWNFCANIFLEQISHSKNPLSYGGAGKFNFHLKPKFFMILYLSSVSKYFAWCRISTLTMFCNVFCVNVKELGVLGWKEGETMPHHVYYLLWKFAVNWQKRIIAYIILENVIITASSPSLLLMSTFFLMVIPILMRKMVPNFK